MTVGVAPVVAGPFILNGVTTTFPFTFRAYRTQDVQPVFAIQNADTGMWVNNDVSSSAYTVELDEDGDGGNVVFTQAPSFVNGSLFLVLDPTFSQTLNLSKDGLWNPADVMTALDKAAERDQVLLALLGRAAIAPLGGDISDFFRPYALKTLGNVTDATLIARLLALGFSRGSGSGYNGGAELSLAAYIPAELALTDAQIAAYPNKTGWTDVSPYVRQAFADAGDLGVLVSYGGLTGNFYYNPPTPVLVRTGSGYNGGAFAYPNLAYLSDGVSVVQDKITGGGLNLIVDPQGAYRKVPKFALQGRTSVMDLSLIGVGLAGSNLLNVSAYPVVTGADEFFTDAPLIVTDHQHLPDGTWVGQNHNIKAGNIKLRCSILGVMQDAYIGDPHLSEEAWATLTASGQVTGTGGNDVEIYTGPCLRVLGHSRKTATKSTVKIEMEQPRWTGITQNNSGGLFNLSWIKLVQQYGVGVDAWHRSVGFDWDLALRGVRYGCKMRAGFSAQGPVFAAPAVSTAMVLGDVISTVDGNDVFMVTTAGTYTGVQPVMSGGNYSAGTKVFTDPGSSLRWTWQCRRPDTGKYNSGSIKIGGERIIQPVSVAVDAYMHNCTIILNGHLMDEYNLSNERGSALEINSHRLIAGSIDKAVYTPWVTNHDYVYGDKISDGSGNVWVAAAAGHSTTIPITSGAVNGVFTDGELRWLLRNNGWKPFGAYGSPFARVNITGVPAGNIQEISGALFKNTPYDGHQSFVINMLSVSAWCQAHPTDALIQNYSPMTTIKHGNSQCYVSGKSDRIYNVVDEARLHVGFNDYYGYDLTAVPDGDYPRQIGNNTLSEEFFDYKNCMAHDFDFATPDDDSGDDS